MLTFITGTPGAGKTLYAVWELARKVPGSTVEATNGEAVPRRLFSNVKDLLVEHEHITADDLNRWHEWAKPGDVILFDEVQEVWRPRGLGTKIPECIAALETHRHKGVDIILVTQHPMLCDPNIRRLINQHFHLRRLSKTMAMVYEWDHCSDPKSTKTALQSRMWFHPRKAYQLYKSAQLHTKPTARIPRLVLVGVFALAGLAYLAPTAYGRVVERFGVKKPDAAAAPAAAGPAAAVASGPARPASSLNPPGRLPDTMPKRVTMAGCVSMANRCACFDDTGSHLPLSLSECQANADQLLPLQVAQAGARASGALSVPPVPVSPSDCAEYQAGNGGGTSVEVRCGPRDAGAGGASATRAPASLGKP